jgi:DNA (cytosine-5)-methyltransferase 1
VRPLLLDLYCCQGGAGKGYVDAGFDVVGVDIEPQPRYPFTFVRCDVLEFLRDVIDGRRGWRRIEAAHASPPCQLDSDTFRLNRNQHHRFFETNWPLAQPHHPAHWWRTTKMGRPPQPGEAMHVVGNFPGAPIARELMDMPWASRDGLREAIPPYYTEHIGRRLLELMKWEWQDRWQEREAA